MRDDRAACRKENFWKEFRIGVGVKVNVQLDGDPKKYSVTTERLMGSSDKLINQLDIE
jgi:hypothetical protein